jgi:hypothetical protein
MKYQFYFAMINYEYNTAILIYMYKYISDSFFTMFARVEAILISSESQYTRKIVYMDL